MIPSRKKPTLNLSIYHWVTHHPVLKLIALALAVLFWMYVRVEITK